MAIFTISGSDTLTLYDRVIQDFADGDNSTITFPNNIAEMKTGKNGNTVYSKNEAGNNGEMTLRLNRGSSDDAFLQSKLVKVNGDFATFELATGSFVKRLGDGEGNVKRDEYNLRGGMFTKFVDGKENVDGDTEQAVSIYTIRFANVVRSIG